jgi:serine/threonine protein kinase
LTPAERKSLIRWWFLDRQADERPLPFLVRKNVLTSREYRLLEIAGEHNTVKSLDNVLSQAAKTRIKNKAAELLSPKQTKADESEPVQISTPKNPLLDRRAFLGRMVGRVRIDSFLGEGGYGIVFRGHHERLDVPVAVKFLRCQRNDLTQTMLERMVAEARLMAKLNHVNVVRLWDLDDEYNPPYLMMEYIDGSSVQSLLGTGGRLPARASVKIIREVARGLRAAAQLGIVHRDIKPANILLGPDNVAKVTDFGLAMLADDPAMGPTHMRRRESGVCGTAEYVDPNQANGTPASMQSDMYSMGATLYHMLVGRPPFEGGSSAQVIHNAATKQVVDPSKLVTSVDPRIGEFTCRLLAKNPKDRFSDYDEMFIAIDELLGNR